jgi:hypothetical protein
MTFTWLAKGELCSLKWFLFLKLEVSRKCEVYHSWFKMYSFNCNWAGSTYFPTKGWGGAVWFWTQFGNTCTRSNWFQIKRNYPCKTKYVAMVLYSVPFISDCHVNIMAADNVTLTSLAFPFTVPGTDLIVEYFCGMYILTVHTN